MPFSGSLGGLGFPADLDFAWMQYECGVIVEWLFVSV